MKFGGNSTIVNVLIKSNILFKMILTLSSKQAAFLPAKSSSIAASGKRSAPKVCPFFKSSHHNPDSNAVYMQVANSQFAKSLAAFPSSGN